jgi:hypothetical protein
VIASPLRPRQRQEQGIAAAGRLAHQGTPYGASLSFATTTHLWPLPDPPSRKPRSANLAALGSPGQFRAAPLPLRCRVPPVRVPGQDFHLRSQHPYLAHPIPARSTNSPVSSPGNPGAIPNPRASSSRLSSNSVVVLLFCVLVLVGMTISFVHAYTLPGTNPRTRQTVARSRPAAYGSRAGRSTSWHQVRKLVGMGIAAVWSAL